MIGLTKETYTVEPSEAVSKNPYIYDPPVEKIIDIRDLIGRKALLNIGNGDIRECTISHLSENNRAIFIVFSDKSNRWLTIDRFKQFFVDFMEGQAPTRQEITKHLIAVGFEQKGVSYFRMGPIEVKLIDEDGIRFSVFNKVTALDLCAFADISATYLFESSDE